MSKIIMTERFKYSFDDIVIGCHHYGKLLSEDNNEVLWMTPTINKMMKLVDKGYYEDFKKFHNSDLVNIDKNIYGYSPYSLVPYVNYPILKTKLAAYLSVNTCVPNIKKVLKESDFYNVDILWLDYVKYYYLKEKVNYKKLIFRCNDDISGFKGIPRSMLDFEDKIIKEADYVFVTAHDLYEKKKKLRSDLIYLPNGVDLSNFVRDSYVRPIEYENNSRKKCIYVGAISEWFDLECISYCVDKLKDVDFYLIGPVKVDLKDLKNKDNVHILGTRKYYDIPNYLYYADVALIPFLINELTNSITPVKLYEYMSVGLDVVSTNFKEMNYINSPAYIAKNKEQFAKYIEEAIGNHKDKIDKVNFARNNTWSSRYNVLKEILGL